MAPQNDKSKEIFLGKYFGDVSVKVNGVRVDIHSDGGMDTYTEHDVKAHPVANDLYKTATRPSAEPKVGEKPGDGTILASETDPAAASAGGKTIRLKFGALSGEAVSSMCSGTLQAGGWVEALAAKPKAGDRMPDGTIFAGVSPDTNKPMYATPADAPLTMTFNAAKGYATKLDAHGHKDWRVPTRDELNVLFNNRAAIGELNVTGSMPAGWYWSASSHYLWYAWVQRFSDGRQDDSDKGRYLSVRCVR